MYCDSISDILLIFILLYRYTIIQSVYYLSIEIHFRCTTFIAIQSRANEFRYNVREISDPQAKAQETVYILLSYFREVEGAVSRGFGIKKTKVYIEHYAPVIGDSLSYFPKIAYVLRGVLVGKYIFQIKTLKALCIRSLQVYIAHPVPFTRASREVAFFRSLNKRKPFHSKATF